MTKLEDIARSSGFIPVLRIQHGDPDREVDLWRCPACFVVVQFTDIPMHQKWHEQPTANPAKT